MNYAKPSIVVLGTAERVIQSGKPTTQVNDSPSNPGILANPAYELDE